MDYIKKVITWWWWGVVYQAIIEPPQLTLLNSVLDWVVAISGWFSPMTSFNTLFKSNHMVWLGVVWLRLVWWFDLPIIGPPQLTLFNFGPDWVVAISVAI